MTPSNTSAAANMFYNTTNLSGQQLKEAVQNAKSQDDVILLVFQSEGKPMTPPQVQEKIAALGYRYLLTSVRRSITSLTTAGKLIKTREQVPGGYGMPVYLWQAKQRSV